jgi:hypothetical protein|tara:strand:- start:428 stop:826 length:399 start_codon:yes stop_codon:yes gene_type:complete
MEDTTGSDKDIKNLFNIILGVEVNIKDNFDKSEELIFKSHIDKLDKANIMECKLMEDGGIDCHNLTSPLWYIIESTFRMLYGPESTDIILWYIYDRFNPDGSIVPLEDPNGKTFIIKNTEDLWSFIKYKSPK